MCTTLLAPVLTPSLTLALAGQWIEVNFWNMFFSIVVVVPAADPAGLGRSRGGGREAEKIKKAAGADLHRVHPAGVGHVRGS